MLEDKHSIVMRPAMREFVFESIMNNNIRRNRHER